MNRWEHARRLPVMVSILSLRTGTSAGPAVSDDGRETHPPSAGTAVSDELSVPLHLEADTVVPAGHLDLSSGCGAVEVEAAARVAVVHRNHAGDVVAAQLDRRRLASAVHVTIDRRAIRYIESWVRKDGRKPLIIRGAGQTGKTTLFQPARTAVRAVPRFSTSCIRSRHSSPRCSRIPRKPRAGRFALLPAKPRNRQVEQFDSSTIVWYKSCYSNPYDFA